jgi:hypothetical protein
VNAKRAIDQAIEESNPLGFTIPGMDSFLAMLSVEDPFRENPEETYAKIEDFVIDNLEHILEQVKPLAMEKIKEVKAMGNAGFLSDDQYGVDEWSYLLTKMVAHGLVEKIIKDSGSQESIDDRYSSYAICRHVYDRVQKRFKELGLPTIKATKGLI